MRTLETPIEFTDEWYHTNEAKMMREVMRLMKALSAVAMSDGTAAELRKIASEALLEKNKDNSYL